MHNNMNMKRIIVISGVNLRSGGTLSILNDCLRYLDDYLSEKYKIIALVHDKSILIRTNNIEFIEFPKSINSYFYRLYYEYIYFYKLSKQLQPFLWFSLHDISPRVQTETQAVYCHNSSPFYNISLRELILDPKFALFSWLYKYVYKINIWKNDYVIVQQNWIRNRFQDMYKIKKCIVAHPVINMNSNDYQLPMKVDHIKSKKVTFFYPSFPRVFKNFEVICDAFEQLEQKYKDRIEVLLTIDGSENRYAKAIFEKYGHNSSIKFIGLQTREVVFELYSKVDCLIFSSKLETWGLPISEFKEFRKPMLLADLPYAHETVGDYDKVSFFSVDNASQLSKYIEEFVDHKIVYDTNKEQAVAEPFANDWSQLFNILLKENFYED